MQWAEDHLFDRNSVVLECQLWQQALERARGESFTLAELKEFTRQRNYIHSPERPNEVTLREVLLRELEIVQSVKDGVGACRPFVENPQPANPKLDDEQRNALDALLRSTNTVSLFRGGAGTGKSFVLRELVEQIRQSDRGVIVLAPQRQQVVDMESAGFPSPTTIANFLIKGELAAGAVVVVDEAGQIGGRQMHQLLQLARERNARVILSGDTRQHGAVEASDALLAIERYSGIKPVELHTIRRQDPALARNQSERARIKQYRKAVEAAAAGKLVESFKRLDQMGAIVACGLGEQADKLADEYLRLAEQKSSAVVVSQTWAEVHRVNSRVRDALKSKGLLGANDVTVQVLEKSDLTNAQKRDQRFYPKDGVIVFNQKVRQAAPGASGKLLGIVKIGVLVNRSPGADDLARVQESLIQRSGGLTLLVMVDDGHLLDDYSALAIQQLVVAGRAQMLASVREGALASDPFEAIVGQDRSVRVPLGPLGEPDVSELVAAELGGPVDARLARDAWSASQGNPMVVSLLVEAGVRSAAIVQHHGLWTLTGSLAPHPRLLALIGAQLELLSPVERNAIDVIALAEPLEAAVTARLVPPGVIASLSQRGLVVGVGGEGQTRLRLVHPLFGDAARERLPEERRNSVITELAAALDLTHGSDADLLLRVAMWGSAAHCPLDPDLLLRAAAVARTRSIESAIHLLQAAMVAGAPASVALDLAQALIVAGRVSEAEAALTDFDRQGLTDAERVSGA